MFASITRHPTDHLTFAAALGWQTLNAIWCPQVTQSFGVQVDRITRCRSSSWADFWWQIKCPSEIGGQHSHIDKTTVEKATFGND